MSFEFRDWHPTVQSVFAAFMMVVTIGTIWHQATIAPLKAEVERQRKFQSEYNMTLQSGLNDLNATVKSVEIYQARIGVHIETLAHSIEKLAIRLDHSTREATRERQSNVD